MPKFCANLTMLYNEHAFLDRFAAAKGDGFEGVEFLFPYAYPKEELAERLQRHGLVQVLHNLPAGDWAKGERGLGALPGREGEFQDGVGRAIAYATALGCEQVNCLAGVPPQGTDPERARRTLVENLRFAAPRLKDAGIKLLLEPVNTRDVPGFFVNRSDQAMGLIEEAGSDNLWLQYDFYHAQVMEGDLVPTFKRLKDKIAHVQIADHPGRNEPGTGEIHYSFVFATLDAEGYPGWVGCEYKPQGRTADGFGWFQPWRGRAA
jgi:hydroxypyruvate isomerase